MKKIFFSILFVFISLFAFSYSVNADCYNKCFSGNCFYSINCEESQSVTCQVVDEKFCGKVSCGNVNDIPEKLPELTSYIITVIQVAIPVILVILGSIDLFKGITAGKDDEIKKGQQMFIKRLVVAAIIFFIVIIVKFIISLIADADNTENMVDCIDCFIAGDCN